MNETLKEKQKILAEQLRELADNVEDGDAITTSIEICGKESYDVRREVDRYFSFEWEGECIDGERFRAEIPRQEISSDEMEELGF